MYRSHHDEAMYTGSPVGYATGGYAPHGFCHSCCHPVAKCCCRRECRKESRELLVQPSTTRADINKYPAVAGAFARATFLRTHETAPADAGAMDVERNYSIAQPAIGQIAAAAAKVGAGKAFIGGACCVHLSVEYVPQTPTAQSLVAVLTDDSEGTVLAWAKTEQPGAGYRIKECIITTKPGADLTVMVVNMTARVRWCEIFSC